MAINKVVLGDETLIDLTSDTVTADSLLEGKTAHDRSGELITGTMSSSGSLPSFTFSGDISYFNYKGIWNNVIAALGDNLTISDVTSAELAFGSDIIGNRPSTFPTISLTKPTQNNSSVGINLNSLYRNAQNLTSVPTITASSTVYAYIMGMFNGCSNLTSIGADSFNWLMAFGERISYSNINSYPGIFSGCSRLRTIDKDFWGKLQGSGTRNITRTYIYLVNAVSSCFVLDEFNYPHLAGVNIADQDKGNIFTGTFNRCFRLKTINLNVNGGTYDNAIYTNTNDLTAQQPTIDLTNYVGYAESWVNLANYGIPEGKEVTDATTYAELKNDLDWWTKDIAYSRYNHDSAVVTLNSLPSFKASNGIGLIKFKGTAGSATDGGAINTLTDAEIAVATAKGWTVTLV